MILSANINKTGYLLSGKKKNVEKYQERKIQKSNLVQQIDNKEKKANKNGQAA